mmetsp:Transcript_23347/g.78828  ORF Transcript_23347/g.78828 Transcript_23347/m.78828 type:complete len:387 (-) Transcript_23347:13-1173(-)
MEFLHERPKIYSAISARCARKARLLGEDPCLDDWQGWRRRCDFRGRLFVLGLRERALVEAEAPGSERRRRREVAAGEHGALLRRRGEEGVVAGPEGDDVDDCVADGGDEKVSTERVNRAKVRPRQSGQSGIARDVVVQRAERRAHGDDGDALADGGVAEDLCEPEAQQPLRRAAEGELLKDARGAGEERRERGDLGPPPLAAAPRPEERGREELRVGRDLGHKLEALEPLVQRQQREREPGDGAGGAQQRRGAVDGPLVAADVEATERGADAQRRQQSGVGGPDEADELRRRRRGQRVDGVAQQCAALGRRRLRGLDAERGPAVDGEKRRRAQRVGVALWRREAPRRGQAAPRHEETHRASGRRLTAGRGPRGARAREARRIQKGR